MPEAQDRYYFIVFTAVPLDAELQPMADAGPMNAILHNVHPVLFMAESQLHWGDYGRNQLLWYAEIPPEVATNKAVVDWLNTMVPYYDPTTPTSTEAPTPATP